MSDYLYRDRLRFESGSGVARLGDVAVALTAPPALVGVDVAEIIYTPSIKEARVRLRHEVWRDMSDQEISAAREALQQLVLSTEPRDPCSPP